MALATTPPGCDANCSSDGSCLLFIGIRIIIKITIYSLSYRPLCILYPVSRDLDYYFLFASGATMSLDMYLSEWWRRFGVYHYPCFLLQTQYNLHQILGDVPSTLLSSSPSEVPTCFPSRRPSSVPSSMPSTIPFSSLIFASKRGTIKHSFAITQQFTNKQSKHCSKYTHFVDFI